MNNDPAITIREIKAKLQTNIHHLVTTYCPGGEFDGELYWTRNPRRADSNIGSFNIRLKPQGNHEPGMFYDYAATEYSGDILDFMAVFVLGKLPGSKDRGDAIKEAKRYLGLPVSDRIAGDIPKATKRYGKKYDRDEAKQQKAARKMWLDATPLIDLSPSHPVIVYLTKTRGIQLEMLKKYPAAIRGADSMTYHGEGEHNKTKWPCMIAAFCGKKGQINSVHRTFLTPDGQKAPVDHVRKIFPSAKGMAIRIAKGKAGVSPEKAARDGLIECCVVLTEGVEDALCWSLFNPDDRVLCVGSIGNFGNAPIFRCADKMIVVRDDFKSADEKKTFIRQMEKLNGRIGQAQKARGYSPSLKIYNTHPHKDLNDLWLHSRRGAA